MRRSRFTCCGRTWPELAARRRWAQIGGDILVGEIDRQVLADGFHAERSTHYHRYALDFYLLALADGPPHRTTSGGQPRSQTSPIGMATALRHMTDAAGRVPLIGDDDGGELFPIDRTCTGRCAADPGVGGRPAESAGARDGSGTGVGALADRSAAGGERRSRRRPGSWPTWNRRFSRRAATTCHAVMGRSSSSTPARTVS